MNVTELIQYIKQYHSQQKEEMCQDLHVPANTTHILCPLHNENTPSMAWVEKANQFYCFGCHNTYDIIDHYQQHHGMTIYEAAMHLAERFSIDTKSLKAPENLLRKKFKITPNDDYSFKQSSAPIGNEEADKYLVSRKIDPSVARDIYWTTSSPTEIFFNHAEMNSNNNQWAYFHSKRRKCDKTDYINPETKLQAKEISIPGGLACFYGLQTLFDKNGKPKNGAFIVEGHIDALRLASELVKLGYFNDFSVLSVPNGGASLRNALENSPTFNRWYYKHCKFLMIIPDADNTGLIMRDQAIEFLDDDKISWMNLANLDGINFTEKHGADLSDSLDLHNFENIFTIRENMPVEDCESIANIKSHEIEDGICSGFATHDYNDAGLKDGRVTTLTGARGQGKTTMGRQMILNVAKQKIKSFCFFGESSMNEEKSNFALLSAEQGHIYCEENSFGKKIYKAKPEAVEAFDKKYGRYITFWARVVNKGENVFDKLISKMKVQVSRGVKVFFIDNMMMITDNPYNIFTEQKRIIELLKIFATDNNVHIILIAHLNAKGEKVSGATEQENLVDTILMYERTTIDKFPSGLAQFTGLPQEELEKVTAIVYNKKVRDRGSQFPTLLEWVESKGQVREICYKTEVLPLAVRYSDEGYCSRPPLRNWSIIAEEPEEKHVYNQ